MLRQGAVLPGAAAPAHINEASLHAWGMGRLLAALVEPAQPCWGWGLPSLSRLVPRFSISECHLDTGSMVREENTRLTDRLF